MKKMLFLLSTLPLWVAPIGALVNEITIRDAFRITAFVWMLLSPVIIGLVALIAFTEGLRSKDKENLPKRRVELTPDLHLVK